MNILFQTLNETFLCVSVQLLLLGGLLYFQHRGAQGHRVPKVCWSHTHKFIFNPYPTAFPYGNGMVLHFYQQQESSTTKTVHKVINKGLKAYA